MGLMSDLLYNVLVSRGFIHTVTNADGLRAALAQPRAFYVGFDPTAKSLHTGHLIPLALAGHLARAGHQPILLAGGGTGMIGDPTDRSATRAMLEVGQVQANTKAIRSQVERMPSLADVDLDVVNNADWLSELRYLEFLREIGRYFSVNEILSTETYRARLQDGKGLNFVEINYRLLQAYDFLHLFRERDCVLQIGGSDQWSNILAGVDLIRRLESVEVFGLVTPLLTTSTGEKMGKTRGGTLWLDEKMTSPFDFYQYWVNVEDVAIEPVFSLLTSLPMAEIKELASKRGPDAAVVKHRLAKEVTAVVHGVEAAEAAHEAAQALFGARKGSVDAVPETFVSEEQVDSGLHLVELLVTTGLAGSRGAARRLVLQGGAYANEQRVDQPDRVFTVSDFKEGEMLLRSGKKRYHRVRLGERN
jgi:tyrosyl-tRNA synthetase